MIGVHIFPTPLSTDNLLVLLSKLSISAILHFLYGEDLNPIFSIGLMFDYDPPRSIGLMFDYDPPRLFIIPPL